MKNPESPKICLECNTKIPYAAYSKYNDKNICEFCKGIIIPENLYWKQIEAIRKKGGKDNGKLSNEEIFEYAEKVRKHINVITVNDEIYYYEDGIWKKDKKEAKLKKIIRKIKPLNLHWEKELIHRIKRDTIKYEEEMDQEPLILVLENGNYDLREIREGKDKFTKHDPEIYSTIKLPITYDPKANSKIIRKFIDDIGVKEEFIKSIEELAGYCLYRKLPLEKFFIFSGKGGNGKTTLTNILSKFIGEQNVSSVTFHAICNEEKQFAVFDMKNKFANFCSDSSRTVVKDAGRLKAMTGNDLVKIEGKYRDAEQIVNTCKIILATNEMPTIYDDTDGFMRRVGIIEFMNNFEKSGIDKEELMQKLIKKEEISTLFNIAIKGLKRILKTKKFSCDIPSKDTRIKLGRISNPVMSFIDECCDLVPNATISKINLHTVYENYCKYIGVCSKPINKFGRTLSNTFKREISSDVDSTGNTRVWRGISFNDFGKIMKNRNLNSYQTDKKNDLTSIVIPTIKPDYTFSKNSLNSQNSINNKKIVIEQTRTIEQNTIFNTIRSNIIVLFSKSDLIFNEDELIRKLSDFDFDPQDIKTVVDKMKDIGEICSVDGENIRLDKKVIGS